MEYQAFVDVVEKRVKKALRGEVKVERKDTMKNNGRKRTGLVFWVDGLNTAPTIYLEEYFEAFRKGFSMEKVVYEVLKMYREVVEKGVRDFSFLRNYQRIQEYIAYKLINYKENQELLEQVPHIRMLDLAVVFYVYLKGERQNAGMLIHTSHMKIWNINEEQLYRDAKKNTEKLFPWVLIPMSEVVAEMLGEEEIQDEFPMPIQEEFMYILTNRERNQGAACMLYEGVLRKIAEIFGENYYILPSSIHELILIPESRCPKETELEGMICEVNETQVEEEEILAWRAYYYDDQRRRVVLSGIEQSGQAHFNSPAPHS